MNEGKLDLHEQEHDVGSVGAHRLVPEQVRRIGQGLMPQVWEVNFYGVLPWWSG